MHLVCVGAQTGPELVSSGFGPQGPSIPENRVQAHSVHFMAMSLVQSPLPSGPRLSGLEIEYNNTFLIWLL